MGQKVHSFNEPHPKQQTVSHSRGPEPAVAWSRCLHRNISQGILWEKGDIIGAYCRFTLWLQGRLTEGGLSATFQDDRGYYGFKGSSWSHSLCYDGKGVFVFCHGYCLIYNKIINVSFRQAQRQKIKK